MTFRNFVPAALAALTVLSIPAFAGTPQQDISKAYSAMNRALKQKKLNNVLTYMTPDYVSISKSGSKSTLKAMRQQLPNIFQQINSMDAKTNIQKVTVKDKRATVRQTTDTKLTVIRKTPGPQPSDPPVTQTVVVTTRQTGEDTWVQTAKGWRMKQSRTIAQKQSATMNGQPIQMPAQGG